MGHAIPIVVGLFQNTVEHIVSLTRALVEVIEITGQGPLPVVCLPLARLEPMGSAKNLAEDGLLSGHIEIWQLADGGRLEGKLTLELAWAFERPLLVL